MVTLLTLGFGTLSLLFPDSISSISSTLKLYSKIANLAEIEYSKIEGNEK
jgi:hypothetical protein